MQLWKDVNFVVQINVLQDLAAVAAREFGGNIGARYATALYTARRQ
jgi:hypothetical protein